MRSEILGIDDFRKQLVDGLVEALKCVLSTVSTVASLKPSLDPDSIG